MNKIKRRYNTKHTNLQDLQSSFSNQIVALSRGTTKGSGSRTKIQINLLYQLS